MINSDTWRYFPRLHPKLDCNPNPNPNLNPNPNPNVASLYIFSAHNTKFLISCVQHMRQFLMEREAKRQQAQGTAEKAEGH